MCGVYPVMNALALGEQISSTYEGRHITLRDDELKHPTIGAGEDGFVDKGDPVIICQTPDGAHGKAIGVAFNDGAASADLIAVDTEGIWNLMVYADNDVGGSAVVPGDQLFIDTVTNQAAVAGVGIGSLSKRRNIATQIPFGYALGSIGAGLEGRIAVKVHFDPTVDSCVAQFNTTVSGGYGKSMRAEITGASEGICGYNEGHLVGAQTGLLYNFGSWINIDAGVTGLTISRVVTPYEGGLWCGEAQTTLRAVFAGQHQCILAGVPGSLHAWRLNVAAAAGNIDALIAAANPQTFGYVVSGATGGAKLGGMPLVEEGGVVYWVRLYASAV